MSPPSFVTGTHVLCPSSRSSVSCIVCHVLLFPSSHPVTLFWIPVEETSEVNSLNKLQSTRWLPPHPPHDFQPFCSLTSLTSSILPTSALSFTRSFYDILTVCCNSRWTLNISVYILFLSIVITLQKEDDVIVYTYVRTTPVSKSKCSET